MNVFLGLLLGLGSVYTLLHYLSAGGASADKPYRKRQLRSWTVFWLCLSGAIHMWIEFAFVFYRTSGLGIRPGLDLYAAADFRYGNPMEAGTAAMEAITAIFDGPLCICVAFAVINDRPWRHAAQLVLTTCQIYGLVWFVLQPLFSETGYAGHLSSDPFLFWGIAVGMNAPWGVVPPILFYKSWRAITACQRNGCCCEENCCVTRKKKGI